MKSSRFYLVNEYEMIKNFDFETIDNYEKYNKQIKRSKRLSYTDCAIVTIMDYLVIKNLISFDTQFNRVKHINLTNNL